MITRLRNVLTGRTHHWNVANNSHAWTLIERAKTFPPTIAPLFVEVTCASFQVVDFLLAPDRGRDAIIKKDVRKITAEQFASVHRLNIWTYVALVGHGNPDVRDSFLAACEDFVGGITDCERKIVADVLRMDESHDLATVTRSLYERIIEVLDYRPSPLPDWLYLHGLFCTAGSLAFQAYKEKIGKMVGLRASGAEAAARERQA